MSSERPVLIAALSGRALAASARRGGYQPLVADFFSDQDTMAIAQCIKMQGGLAQGFEADELLTALGRLAAGRKVEGLVCGVGFEDRPSLLASLGERWPLLGNDARRVAGVKDPYSLAALARQTRIPHPEISRHPPSHPTEWLVKRIGGAGGSHIATPHEGSSPAHYFQRRVAGQAISALVLSDGVNPMVLGFSQQWCAPTKRRPFRYGGAVRPAMLDPTIEHRLTVMTQNLLKAACLVGLNSIDFLVDGETIWMLEINPRPGATLDLFEPAGASLFALHVAACRGALPDRKPELTHAEASAIIYAQADVAKIAPIAWPEWTTDHPSPSIRIEAGDPLCTIRAVAPRPPEARALLNARRDTLAAMIKASLS